MKSWSRSSWLDELPGPPESPPPSTQVEGALSAIEESVQATPVPLEGKEASAEQSVESPEAKAQPSMATPTEEDTRPKALIRGEWRKVPDGYPADARSCPPHHHRALEQPAQHDQHQQC